MQVGKVELFPDQSSWLNLNVRNIPWTCSISMHSSASNRTIHQPPKIALWNGSEIAFQFNTELKLSVLPFSSILNPHPQPQRISSYIASHLSSEKRILAERLQCVVRYQEAQCHPPDLLSGQEMDSQLQIKERERFSVKIIANSTGK